MSDEYEYNKQEYDGQEEQGNQTGGSYSGSGYGSGSQSGSYGGGYSYGGQNGSGYGNRNGASYGSQNGYGNYQYQQGNYQYSGSGAGQNPDNGKKKKEKKKGGAAGAFWKKALAVVVGGICFGVCAGISFLAVSSLGESRSAAVTGQAAITEETAAPENQQAAEQKESNSGIRNTVIQGATGAVVTDVTEVVEATMPSIVSITNQSVEEVYNFWGQTVEQEQESAGSGIIIGENDTELLIVTNNHVVDGSTKLSVKFIDDEVMEAQIKGTNPSMDLAVIAVKLETIPEETKNSISIAVVGDSDSLKVGQPVIAIGNALGYGQSVTTGVVSALNRVLEVSETGTSNALIQTDAAINPGNSGGALLDINGQVIGINSNKIGGSTIEGMGYAIPISSAKPIIEELMNRETKEKVEENNRGYLGISCINVTSAMGEAYGMPEGIYVAQVYPGTGAAAAGLVKGDIIVGFDGNTITTQDDLLSTMQYYAVGDTVELTIMHGNPTEGYDEKSVSVTLTSQEAMNQGNE